jgi:VWFA-related protein
MIETEAGASYLEMYHESASFSIGKPGFAPKALKLSCMLNSAEQASIYKVGLVKVIHLVALFLAGTLIGIVGLVAAQDRVPSSPSAGSQVRQSEAPTAATPLLRSTANLVIVDVVVTHDGHPVKSLSQPAFHVFEDGREQAIKVFEEHGPDEAQPAKAPALPPNTYTNIPDASAGSAINVLLLDAINTPPSDQAYARKKIIEYLKTIPPGTRMAVFTLASRLRLVQGFTTDSSVLLAALNRITPTQSIALRGNPGESEADRLAALGVAQSPIGSAIGLNPIDSVIESLHQFEADEEASLIDRRVQITIDALKQLAAYLGALPGRKNVIWFSASFPLSVGPQSSFDAFKSLRSYAPQWQQVGDLLTASRVAVYPVDARGLITNASAARPNRPAAVSIGGTGRTGMIDPNAFPADPSQSGDRTDAEFAAMLQLADGTGGVPFYNNNALKKALAQAIENGSNYYTLAYTPEDKNFNGAFRKLQVKLSGHDYHLAYRHGYFADSPGHNGNALLGMGSIQLQPDALPSSQILFRARVLAAGDPTAGDLQPPPGPAGDLAGKLKPPVERYWIEYTADMHQVSAEVDANGLYRATIEFMAIAYDRDGKVVNAGRRAFRLGMPPAKYDEILQNGYSVRNDLDLPPGDFWLRLAVHDVAADRVGSIEVPLKVLAKKGE